MPQQITLRVNGSVHNVFCEPDTPLLYILRNDLDLKGAKFGCGLGQCGACRIIIDGQALPSCKIPVISVQDREITTIEGLGTGDDLHPLQKAFIEEQAVQCGFCTSGIIIAAKALLDRNPSPTDEEIRTELSDNLCRCGVYDRIVRAIKRAAGQPAGGPLYEEGAGRDRELETESRLSASANVLPRSIKQNPDLDSWIRINTDGTITVITGKVELGQDIRTSFAMIGADELDVSLERIRVVTGDTAQSPDEGYTAGSMSLETSGNAIRYAAAKVRQIALSAAQVELDAPIERFRVKDGTITDPATGRNVTYWDLLGGKRFNCQVNGDAQPKLPEAYRIVGRPIRRLDLTPKVTGDFCFIHDLELPDMVHGRIVRPPNYESRLVSVDEGSVHGMPGIIKVVRDGSFLALIAEREEQAVRAMEVLRKSATWKPGVELPARETLFDYMQSQPDQPFLVVDGNLEDDPIPPINIPKGAAHTLNAAYYRPYHMHASPGPSTGVAQLVDGKMTVWTHNQGVYPLREALANVLGMPEDDIRTIHMHGPGCFGHNGADDAALDAALLARALPGRPVSLKWTRADENAWEPYGSAMVIKMQASMDSEGDVIDWNHDVYSYTHSTRPHGDKDSSGLLAAWHLAEPFPRFKPGPAKMPGGIHRNADPLYSFSRRRIIKHFLPDSPLRVSALRGLGSYANVFAIESFMDELAHAAGINPVEFRLCNLKDDRARDVIEAAVAKAGQRPDGLGRGVAFARYKNQQSYVAVVVDLSVNRVEGDIRLERAVIAADAGQIVNPDSLSSQLEGVFTQAASWTLKEEVCFDQHGITSIDWHSYPMFSFHDAPEIETVLLNRPGLPYLGIGEGAQGPAPAAIANAVFDAVGIRLRRIPFTPERVKEALG